jgi:ArsR family transcriptional regulator, arsenate/arsenite/antimonite-responsive transcriptional repressor
MPKEASGYSLELFFRALADRTRLRLLNLMLEGETCVCYFVGVLMLSQPKISRHLAYLRRAQIVTARRQGKWMHYKLSKPEDSVVAAILQKTLHHLRRLPEMKRDREMLKKACCRPERFVIPVEAPLPTVAAP